MPISCDCRAAKLILNEKNIKFKSINEPIWNRRVEFLKLASKISENSKIAIRNIRRDGNDKVKTLEKNKDIGEDVSKKYQSLIEEITIKHIKEIDENLKTKEDDLRKI